MPNNERLRKFIYHPVVLASIDQNDFREFPMHLIAAHDYEHDWESKAAPTSGSMRNFESAIVSAGKELFEFVRIL